MTARKAVLGGLVVSKKSLISEERTLENSNGERREFIGEQGRGTELIRTQGRFPYIYIYIYIYIYLFSYVFSKVKTNLVNEVIIAGPKGVSNNYLDGQPR